jgi:OOP family OmpA-OmpF porin
MVRRTIAALVASACLVIGGAANAEIRPRTFTASPFLGGYTFEGDQHVETSFIFGARLGYDYTKRVGVEALVDFGKTESHGVEPKRDVRLLTAGVDGLYYFMPDSKLVPFLAGGIRGVRIEDTRNHANDLDLDKERIGVAYGAGIKYFLAPELALRGDVRHIVLFNEGWNHLEYTLGLAFAFGGQAVAPPPPPPPPVAPPPPPPPPPAAPTVSLTANPVSIEAGKCADLNWSSSNASGVSIDQGVGSVAASGSRQVCPPASTTYTATATGPGGSATSAASIGVRQPPPPPPPPAAPAAPSVSISAVPASIQKGQCSNLSWNSSNATNVSIDQGVGAVAASGSKQVCPASTTSYTVTGSGAGGTRTASTSVSVTAPPPPPPPAPVAPPPPPPPPKEPTKEELTIVLNIEFDTDKSVIKPAYEPEVAKVAEFMKKYPQVKGVIEGHTDNIGSKPYNDKLSLRRANAVKKQLVDKYGIDASRLSTAGYGFSKPIADNKTEEGRQKNRRIVANFDKVTIIKP